MVEIYFKEERHTVTIYKHYYSVLYTCYGHGNEFNEAVQIIKNPEMAFLCKRPYSGKSTLDFYTDRWNELMDYLILNRKKGFKLVRLSRLQMGKGSTPRKK